MKTYKLFVALLLAVLAVSERSSAQLNPMGAQYFQNQYISNAAMAGASPGLNLGWGYRRLWTNIPGNQGVQMLAADYSLNDKVGFGLNINMEQSGLFKQSRTMTSYAYHLPLGDKGNSKLSFGISAGFMNQRITTEEIKGNPNDISVNDYNNRRTYFDGDFGMAYRGKRLTLQAALPNLKGLLNRDLVEGTVDRVTFLSAASYLLPLTSEADGFVAEPKIVYRGVKGYDNIIDAGVNFSYLGKVNIFGMYHSTGSTTFGLGMKYQSINIVGMYSTTTSALSNYTNGSFEIGLIVKLFE